MLDPSAKFLLAREAAGLAQSVFAPAAFWLAMQNLVELQPAQCAAVVGGVGVGKSGGLPAAGSVEQWLREAGEKMKNAEGGQK